MPFRWNEWNLDHAGRHGVSQTECEAVVQSARRPYPENIGRGDGDRLVQVIYVLDDEGTTYVIHARPLNDREKAVPPKSEVKYAQGPKEVSDSGVH